MADEHIVPYKKIETHVDFKRCEENVFSAAIYAIYNWLFRLKLHFNYI
jgi:hypothetical protein